MSELFTGDHPRCVAEIGVGSPETCRTTRWMGSPHTRLELYEANPETAGRLLFHYSHHVNVTIRNVAIMDVPGDCTLIRQGDASAIKGVTSPLAFSNLPEDIYALRSFTVAGQPLSTYDRGDIDVALIDVEGCEWRVLSTMVSRPRLLVLETHMDCAAGRYQTPDWPVMAKWLHENGYRLEKRDLSDSWYVRD